MLTKNKLQCPYRYNVFRIIFLLYSSDITVAPWPHKDKKLVTLIPQVSILIDYVGEYSPHVDSTVNFNGRLDPEKCTWMKINDASMVVLEQTEKVAQAVILFVQGLGYTLRKPLSS